MFLISSYLEGIINGPEVIVSFPAFCHIHVCVYFSLCEMYQRFNNWSMHFKKCGVLLWTIKHILIQKAWIISLWRCNITIGCRCKILSSDTYITLFLYITADCVNLTTSVQNGIWVHTLISHLEYLAFTQSQYVLIRGAKVEWIAHPLCKVLLQFGILTFEVWNSLGYGM